LIGTPDLVRDAGVTNQREALGALKALQVLGYVEIGKLDPQTVAWCWTAGRGQRRVYQRGYYAREEAGVAQSDVRLTGTAGCAGPGSTNSFTRSG
jgi:hypothetical protein